MRLCALLVSYTRKASQAQRLKTVFEFFIPVATSQWPVRFKLRQSGLVDTVTYLKVEGIKHGVECVHDCSLSCLAGAQAL
jgi:hypothetical protein